MNYNLDPARTWTKRPSMVVDDVDSSPFISVCEI